MFLQVLRYACRMITVIAGIFHRCTDGQNPEVLLFQRAKHDSGAHFFEFPGGKKEMGESDKDTLQRELREELDIEVEVQDFLANNQFHSGTGKIFDIHVYFVNGPVNQIRLIEHQSMKWVREDAILISEVLEGDRVFIRPCFERLKQVYQLNDK